MNRDYIESFTKEELVNAIMESTKDFKNSYGERLFRVLKNIEFKKEEVNRKKRLEESLEADRKYEEARIRYNEFLDNLLKTYNVPVENGTYKYSDLFELVPKEKIYELETEISIYNRAVKKMQQKTKLFMEGK